MENKYAFFSGLAVSSTTAPDNEMPDAHLPTTHAHVDQTDKATYIMSAQLDNGTSDGTVGKGAYVHAAMPNFNAQMKAHEAQAQRFAERFLQDSYRTYHGQANAADRQGLDKQYSLTVLVENVRTSKEEYKQAERAFTLSKSDVCRVRMEEANLRRLEALYLLDTSLQADTHHSIHHDPLPPLAAPKGKGFKGKH